MARSQGQSPERRRLARSSSSQAGQRAEREQLRAVQRARIMLAMAQACGDLGAGRVTVADVVQRAGVSRRTFYECYGDCEDCLLAALEHAIELGRRRVAAAYDPAAPWAQRIRQGLVAALVFLEQEPAFGSLIVVGALGAGPRALERRADLLRSLERVVDEGRRHARPGHPASSLTAEGALGAVAAVVHRRLTAQRGRPRLLELTGELMSMIVLPYRGAGAVRRELARPAVRRARRSTPAASPLQGLTVRMTRRTVRVLIALGEAPRGGLSNLEVAQAAGVADPGQISRLLRRLARAGLIENAGARPGRGRANAWRLTDDGRRIFEELAANGKP